MKISFLLAIAVSASAEVLHTHQRNEAGISDQYKTQTDVGDYAFGYNEDHNSGGSFRREIGDPHGNKFGSYGLRDSDGRVRVVNYIADDFGFRADIQTNEPGTKTHRSGASTVTKMNIGGVYVPAFIYSGGPTGIVFEKHEGLQNDLNNYAEDHSVVEAHAEAVVENALS